MNGTYYLVDNNALLAVTTARRSTALFRLYCRLTDDVAYEARYITGLERVPVVAPNARSLERLRTVMGSLTPGETDLVDLYGNKGTADPALIATALTLADEEGDLLIPDNWVIITLDKAIRRVASEHHIQVITRSSWTPQSMRLLRIISSLNDPTVERHQRYRTKAPVQSRT